LTIGKKGGDADEAGPWWGETCQGKFKHNPGSGK